MESAKAAQNGGLNRNRRRHEHDLHWEEGLPRYKCKGCKQFGANKGYKCPSCAEVMLHEVCANSEDEVKRYGQQLKFRSSTTCSHSCHACRTFIKGFMFESESRDLRLHPLCMALPETFIYSKHAEHTLELLRNSRTEFKCSWCENKHSGWRFKCQQTPGCENILDLDCCMVDIHQFKGIAEVAVPSCRKRTLRMFVNGGKTVVSFLVPNLLTSLGGDIVTNAVEDQMQEDDEHIRRI